jgi:ergothioneine biosynthesis protein EgtB
MTSTTRAGTALEAASRGDLLGRLAGGRALTDALFGRVREKALYDRPIAERHRVVFYVGHLEAFDWNLLREPLSRPSLDPGLDGLFAFGIDPLGGRRPADTVADWPKPAEVARYVERVRLALDSALAAPGPDAAAGDGGIDERLHVAVEHRLMHAETLAYMLHRMPFEAKRGDEDRVLPRPSGPSPDDGMVEIPGGVATLGARRGEIAFGWDNEYEAHEVVVAPFAIDRFMVTNARFLRFVEAGGYEDESLWSEDDWDWVRRDGVRHPVHWEEDGSRWLYRGMFARAPLPSSWPVYVSHAEASAYARWVGKELPTEAQWHRAAYGTPRGGERDYPWGADEPRGEHGNFGFRHWDPMPVDAFPAGTSAFGVVGLLGNGWEWTKSPFSPFPGFATMPFYPGYSADFFDGAHFVLKGGSPRTATSFLRRSFRNWFQPHYPHVYAGFRCVAR